MMRSAIARAFVTTRRVKACPAAGVGIFRQVPSLPEHRWFSAAAPKADATSPTPKLASTLQSELQYEKSNYEAAANIAPFLEKSGWKLTEKGGDINMTLKKQIGELAATVEFQLVSPSYNGEGEGEEDTPIEPQETTDFSVTVEKPNGNGAIFYCTTVGNDEKYRFIVGNVRYFEDNEEKTSVSAYNGPEFEDLDDHLQSGIDEWLSSLGINEELCDFIDAMAVDKEQREYMRWIEKVAEIVQQ
ncbi:uncharacterized protein LOC129617841 [Condylostylus longicornis]|uniref:uncharacterized protein LOC129617841 n=1 Tax=Condylostylus longicornis TaxID=2530218 RepID=UPI00244E57C9|nr:uncharacterized protein LOC129617841 [Condylostylus longicornis]